MADLFYWSVAGAWGLSGLVVGWMARKKHPALLVMGLLAILVLGLSLAYQSRELYKITPAIGWGTLTGTGLWLMGAFASLRFQAGWGMLLPLLAPPLTLAVVPNDTAQAFWGISIASVLAWLFLGRVWQDSEPTALSVLALSWTTVLASRADTPEWLGVCFAGAGVLTMAFMGWRARRGSVSWWSAYALLFAGFAGVAVGYRLSGYEAPLLELVLLALIGATLARGVANSEEWGRYALVMWGALAIACFGVMKGYGVALCALMISLYAVVMGHSRWMRTPPNEHALYTVGALLLTTVVGFRLFTLINPLLTPRADLYQPYTLFGFLLALVGIGALVQWWSQHQDEAPLWRTLLAGFWSALTPLAVVSILTERAGAGWAVGVLGASLSAYLYGNPLQRWIYPLSLMGITVLLAFTPSLMSVGGYGRTTRVAIGIGFTLLVLLTVGISTWLERRRSQ